MFQELHLAKFRSVRHVSMPKHVVVQQGLCTQRQTHPRKVVWSREISFQDKESHATISTPHSLEDFGLQEARAQNNFVGGSIWVDHASGYIDVRPQVSFSAADTLHAKLQFERMAQSCGVKVVGYHTDNGIFGAAEFVDKIREMGQDVRFSGVGTPHQNGVAERAIGTVVRMATSMLLHAAIRWPDVADASLWPMVLEYAAYVYNHMPHDNSGIAPIDIWTRTTWPREQLRNLHVWGCPAYVLDPKLQGGNKLPKWQPRSRRGIFVGLSRMHSSSVGQILNLRTGTISPQFHVVYDDWFSTVMSNEEMPSNWEDLCITSRFQNYVEGIADLDDEWLADDELAARRHHARVQEVQPPPQEILPPPAPEPTEPSTPEPSPVRQAIPVVTPTPNSPQPTLPSEEPSPNVQQSVRTRYGRRVHPPQRYDPSKGYVLQSGFDYVLGLLSFYGSASQREQINAHLASLWTDPTTGVIEFTDPMVFATKNDPDRPTYREALMGDEAEGYGEAMTQEISDLEGQGTWTVIPRSSLPPGKNVLPGIWAFQKKRFPDGRVRKLKARFCVRGDRQVEGIDFFETYAPVVPWSTVRLLLVMAITFNLSTVQVDFSNAFAQATLEEEVYISLPQGFAHSEGADVVLRLNKSLYGLKQAALCWYELLKKGLEDIGFKMQSNTPCLFIHPDVICLVYVDDCLFFAREKGRIDAVIAKLKRAGFSLKVEGDVNAFLGIDISRNENGSFVLKQPSLIQRVLQATKMQDCHAKPTPAKVETLGTDVDGAPRKDDWSYPSVIGMMLYLSTNTRPDIAFAVHQCARFTNNAKASHEEAVKRICRYLKGTQDQGMIVKPSEELKIDCYVDSDFAGLWGSEDNQDPVCVKSRTGYVLMLAGCPLLWVSKLQTEIALSTMEAEYIALSQAMRDLLPMRAMIQEVIGSLVPSSVNGNVTCLTHSTIFEDNDATRILATSPRMTPRSKHIAVKYHFFREKVASGEVQIQRVDSSDQKADIFTKGLVQVKFEALRKSLMGW